MSHHSQLESSRCCSWRGRRSCWRRALVRSRGSAFPAQRVSWTRAHNAARHYLDKRGVVVDNLVEKRPFDGVQVEGPQVLRQVPQLQVLALEGTKLLGHAINLIRIWGTGLGHIWTVDSLGHRVLQGGVMQAKALLLHGLKLPRPRLSQSSVWLGKLQSLLPHFGKLGIDFLQLVCGAR